MSQVGFRQETPSSDSGLPPPASAQPPESSKPVSSDMPSLPPPRPKSAHSGPPARPKLPSRPERPNPSKPLEALPPDPSDLIDLSKEDSPVNASAPVPKPRPRPAARSTISTPEDAGSEPTLPSPIKPTWPTIIRPMPGPAGEEPAKETQRDEQALHVSPEDRSGPKLPSYIHTTASNDASVNELKAAFEKRKSQPMNQLSSAPAPAPKPKPKPKPDVAQKPSAQSKPEGDNRVTPASAGESAEERLMASINSELSGGNAQSSPTAPSRRKRPTIIRAGVVPQTVGDNAEKSEEGEVSKPMTSVQSPVGRPQTSPKLQKRQLFEEDKTMSEDTEKSAPARPKPAARKSTPTGPPKSISAQDLSSSQLTTLQNDPASESLTPPPRKRKTGPPRPSQGPSLGSLSQSSVSQSSLSNKTESNPSLAPEKEPPAESKPTRSRGAPPSRPQAAPVKPPPTKSTSVPIETSSGSTRQVIIHEVYPQSEAPKLPPRPGPGHPLFHYMMGCPYGIAVATHDYQSLQTDELSFNEGDVIVLLRQVDGSWFYGKNGEIEGIFPANFVKVMEPLSGQGVQSHDQASANAPVDMLVDFGDGFDQDTGSGPRCRARFDYDGESSEDLTFLEGEIIKLLEHVGDDWLRGELNGKSGIFPATFVEVIEDLPATPGSISGDSDWTTRNQSDNSLVREAMYTFHGEDAELSFKAGDKIQLISYVSADWLFGEANGKQGKFPSAFIDNMPLHLPQYVGPKVKNTVKETVAERQEAARDVRQEKLEEKKTEKQKEKQVEKQQPPTEEPRVQTPQSDGSMDDEAYAIAIHEFKGETAHDLSFREADKVILLEWVNDEWLKGKSEMTGTVGIFPASYVQVIKDLKKKGSRVQPESEEETRTKVKALYEFTGENSQELSFKEGTVFTMHGPMSGTDDWRTGEIDGQVGLFPVSFVEEHRE